MWLHGEGNTTGERGHRWDGRRDLWTCEGKRRGTKAPVTYRNLRVLEELREMHTHMLQINENGFLLLMDGGMRLL